MILLQKTQKFCLLCLCLVLLGSCKDAVYEKFHEVPEKSWDKAYIMEYYADLKPEGNYQVKVAFSYLAFITHNTIQYNVKVTSPSQKTIINSPFTTPLRDAQGNQLGDVMGDYGDIEDMIVENLSTQEGGKYKIEITQAMEAKSVGGVTRVGLKILKAKK